MKYFAYFLLLGGVLTLCALTGCSELRSKAPDPGKSWEIAALLPRTPKLGSRAEQTYVMDSYRTLTTAITRHPKQWKAYLQLAQLFMMEARITGEHGHYYPAALALLDQVADQAKTQDYQFQAAFLKASVLLSLHQFEEARVYGQKALQVNEHHALTYGTLVDAHVELGAYEEARRLADQMAAIRPDLRSYARISYLRELYGEVEGAAQAMEMAIDAGIPGQEDIAWCRLTLGNLHLNYGNLTAAKNQYLQALAERPNYPFALAGLAAIEAQQGNRSRAMALLDSACTLIPEVGFYIQQARLLKESGNKEELYRHVQDILAMLADDEAHGHSMDLEYAQVHLCLTENWEAAMKYVQKAYQERPNNIQVNHLLATLYHLLGDEEKALNHAQKSLRTGIRDPEYLGLIGVILWNQGSKEKGRTLVLESLGLNPFQDGLFLEEMQKIARTS